MKFNKTVQYGLKVITYMVKEPDKLYTAVSLHRELDIPYKYLTHIMTKFAKASLLLSQKGRHGGFRLVPKYGLIQLCAVVNALDERDLERECILGGRLCDEHEACALHHKWDVPKKAIDEMLDNTYLIDL